MQRLSHYQDKNEYLVYCSQAIDADQAVRGEGRESIMPSTENAMIKVIF